MQEPTDTPDTSSQLQSNFGNRNRTGGIFLPQPLRLYFIHQKNGTFPLNNLSALGSAQPTYYNAVLHHYRLQVYSNGVLQHYRLRPVCIFKTGRPAESSHCPGLTIKPSIWYRPSLINSRLLSISTRSEEMSGDILDQPWPNRFLGLIFLMVLITQILS